MVNKVEATARQASNSRQMTLLAEFGLAVRGFIYLVIGWLAIQIALGHHTQEANQRGALATVAHHSYGRVLLWVLGFGFAAYALWRLTEAAFGTPTEGRKAGPRLQSLIRGIIYAGFAVTTFAFVLGNSRHTQRQQQVTATAKLMKHTAGRWLVGLVGVIVVVVGLALVVEGLRQKFKKQLRLEQLNEASRKALVAMGTVGTTARGIVFAVAGALVVQAAVSYEPQKSTGLDGALRTLAHRAYGPWILGVLAIGLIVFGLYGLASARYTKT